MILCVTLNACLDKTLTVPEWRPGDLVRGTLVPRWWGVRGTMWPGRLTGWGEAARPVSFLGGATGRRCEELLREQDISHFSGRHPGRNAGHADRPADAGERHNRRRFLDPYLHPAISEAEAESLYRAVRPLLARAGSSC